MWSRRTVLISRRGKCERLWVYSSLHYAGAQLWCQAEIASSLCTPHLSAERPNYSSTFSCTRHKELPVSKLWFLDLLPPRAARCLCCWTVSLLCRTLTRSCWSWGFEDLILLLRVMATECFPANAAISKQQGWEGLSSQGLSRRCCWGTTSGLFGPKWIPLTQSETTTQCKVL